MQHTLQPLWLTLFNFITYFVVSRETINSKFNPSAKSLCFLRNSSFSRDIIAGEWKVLPSSTHMAKCSETEGTERSCTTKKKKEI